ncbi:MAG: hypothetical protein M3011_01900 [Actinomycetota bacterium]|nr:hypothetical protein [Actinomycetota bacterium]
MQTDVDLGRARGHIAASGSVEVVDAPAAEWRAVGAGEQKSTTATLGLSGAGPGEITGTVEVLDADGGVEYSSAAAIDVLATPTEVLTGTNGPLVLQLEHLDHEHAAGRITDDQFSQMREQILGGGAG